MYWILLGIAIVALIAACLIVPVLRRRRDENNLIKARQLFQLRREWLEARFVTLASQSGKPRGLAWVQCDFDDNICFARDRSTGQLHCFVGVTVSFEAIEGGGMEDVEAVGNLRAATAVFGYDGKEWGSEGRTIFNLNPDEAIEHFQAQPV
ncbi:MAG: hypothetical protein ACI9HK_005039 [Pirellulaceae bacterium]|jgi:hypothetical protein